MDPSMLWKVNVCYSVTIVLMNTEVLSDRTLGLKNNMQARRKQYGLQQRVTNTIHGSQGQTLQEMATEISQHNPDFNLWDKGQLIILLTWTKKAKQTIFVGNKQDTLDALKAIFLSRNQWSDYIEHVLSIVTINDNSNAPANFHTMNQNDYPFCICDISLPNPQSGFIYFLISVRDKSFTYIGSTICLLERLPQHNSGYGAFKTCPNFYVCMIFCLTYVEINLTTKIYVSIWNKNGKSIETC